MARESSSWKVAKYSLVIVLSIAAVFLAACSQPQRGSMQRGLSDPSTCLSHIPTVQHARNDPRLDGATPTPTPEQSTLPTCTPPPTISPPGPTPTPFPTYPASSGLTGASAPINVSISPWNETYQSVAWQPGIAAATWADARDADYLTILTPHGVRTIKGDNRLGDNRPLAVAISPMGRVHLATAGSYAYSDDQGQSWSEVAPLPPGDIPHLVVEQSGYVRYFFVGAQGLMTSLQQADGSWSGPESILHDPHAYDAVPSQTGVIVAALNSSGLYLYRLPEPGPVAFIGGNYQRVQLTYRRGVVVAGLNENADFYGGAFAVRSLDDGYTWSDRCKIQTSGAPIESVAAFPTAQGDYVALWTWWQPAGLMSYQPFVVVSQVKWLEGEACVPIWPGAGQADLLTQQGGGPPGMFFSRSGQVNFKVAVGEGGGVMALECYTPKGVNEWADGTTDFCLAHLNPDGFLSGTVREAAP